MAPAIPHGRIEDWATLAIASALAGRERDASNAFLVSLALASDFERHCRAALDAFAIYGETAARSGRDDARRRRRIAASGTRAIVPGIVVTTLRPELHASATSIAIPRGSRR